MQESNELPFAELMELHLRHENDALSLPKSFLDGYFMSISPVASKVRALFYENGFDFEEISDINGLNFQAQYNLVLLPDYVKNKRITYFANINAIKHFYKSIPHLKDVDVRVVINQISNKLTHECLHLLLTEKSFDKEIEFVLPAGKSIEHQQNWVIKHLANEANTLAIELISSIVKPSPSGAVATFMNCHQCASYPDEYRHFIRFMQVHGQKKLLTFLAKGFFVSNFRPEEKRLTQDMLDPFVVDLELSDAEKSVIDRFLLTPSFKKNSNRRFFASIGLKVDFVEFVNGIPIEETSRNEYLLEVTDYASSLLT